MDEQLRQKAVERPSSGHRPRATEQQAVLKSADRAALERFVAV